MSEVTKEDLELINKHTRRELKEDEVYTFPLVLCTNQVDRDFERFDDSALDELAVLCIGKTVIRDHIWSADNQTARIYRTQVENKGAGVKHLTAFAYLPVTDSTKDFIAQLDAGIKKEVSIGCAAQQAVCSICGKSRQDCMHVAGRMYSGDMCVYTLKGITDAYEVSFVAVPAQPDAGVIKSFNVRKSYTEGEEEQNTVQGAGTALDERLVEAEIKNIERKMNYEYQMQ